MVHLELQKLDKSRLSSDRNFGLFLSLLLVSTGIAASFHGSIFGLIVCQVAALISLVVSIAQPKKLNWLHRSWAKVGRVLGLLTNPILLFIIFAFALIPFATLSKFMRRDALSLRRDPSPKTYWEEPRGEINNYEWFKREF